MLPLTIYNLTVKNQKEVDGKHQGRSSHLSRGLRSLPLAQESTSLTSPEHGLFKGQLNLLTNQGPLPVPDSPLELGLLEGKKKQKATKLRTILPALLSISRKRAPTQHAGVSLT